ncbi:MAG: hypothetical protein IT426_05365 [Pirellulales bacterium]|nr:hypothetical protein [Pirellulales bacterium]
MHRFFSRSLVLLFMLGLALGCGRRAGNDPPQKELAKSNSPPAAKSNPAIPPSSKNAPPAKRQEAKPAPAAEKNSEKPPTNAFEQELTPPGKQPDRASLGDLLKQPADSMSRMVPDYPRIVVDDKRVAAAGIRKIPGKRLTLYTDVPGEEIDRLPEVFDLAFPQYCEYFGVDPKTLDDWHATGFLMKDRKRFAEAGLIPAALPNFRNGFSWNFDLWLYDQTSDYYRRHLLLHEGVHSFMNTVLGGCGAPWYMEGMAEMLSTHAWRDGRLALNYFPQNREEVPELGRIRIIRDEVAAGRALPLAKIIEYPASAHHANDGYAWSWAAAKFLDAHPRYQKRFRELSKNVPHVDFNANFRKSFAADLPEMCEEWQAFAAGLEYGYDIPRTAIDFTPGKPIGEKSGSTNGESIAVTVSSDRGWQNSGIRLDGGRKYELTASGRWRKTCRPAFWSGLKNPPDQIELEPNGVSIRYYRGRPLGILLAAVRPDRPNPEKSSVFLNPLPLGPKASLVPDESGTLFFKLNDSGADLESNEGGIACKVARQIP